MPEPAPSPLPTPPSAVVPLPALEAQLDHRAWVEQMRDPTRAADHGRVLLAAASPGSPGAALGHFHVAWAELRWGSMDAARRAQGELDALLNGSVACAAHPAALAAWRDLNAGFARREGRFEEALALLAPNLALPDDARLAHAHCATATSAAIACGALHRMDEALRHFHRALAWAEASGDSALIANAVGNVGAAHYDVYNLDDALRWCREAYEQSGLGLGQGTRLTATANLILVLCERNSHPQALPLLEELLAAHALVHPAKRGKYLTIGAEVLRGCGETDRAQALLDDAAALRAPADSAPLEWVGVWAELALARGDGGDARTRIEAALSAHRPANVNDLPLNIVRLRDCAVRCCEALGDWPAALAHQRALMEMRERLLGRSARARRVALEVEHELDRARMQRDAARVEQQRLAALNAALVAANRAKTEFLAAASHDLRQPVHALSLQVAALRAEPLTERQRTMTDRVGRCVGALSDLFDGLLDLSRLDAGIVHPKWQNIALPALLATLVEQHQPEAHRKGLNLSLRLPRAHPPPATRSDPLLLERLLRNLLVNAIRYTDTGAVLVALRRCDAGWCVQIRDSGVGIAAELQARVFDAFFQAENKTRRHNEGLGIGLSIVARLAHVLGHDVTLRSAPGRGTCISVRMARSSAPPDRAAAALPSQAPLALRVLVIDDDGETRAAMSDLLVQWGCDARASDRADTRTIDSAWQPDAALIDLRLRDGIEGIAEATSLQRRFGADLPCLIVTGETSPERLRDLHASGLAWASKPLAAPTLWRWLSQLGST